MKIKIILIILIFSSIAVSEENLIIDLFFNDTKKTERPTKLKQLKEAKIEQNSRLENEYSYTISEVYYTVKTNHTGYCFSFENPNFLLHGEKVAKKTILENGKLIYIFHSDDMHSYDTLSVYDNDILISVYPVLDVEIRSYRYVNNKKNDFRQIKYYDFIHEECIYVDSKDDVMLRFYLKQDNIRYSQTKNGTFKIFCDNTCYYNIFELLYYLSGKDDNIKNIKIENVKLSI